MLENAYDINGPKPREHVYSTPGTYTYTVPPKVYFILAEVIGGGGGGQGGQTGTGNTSSVTTSGGGGGSGSDIALGQMIVTPGETLTIVVGAGGIGSSPVAYNGTQIVGGSGGKSSITGAVDAVAIDGAVGGRITTVADAFTSATGLKGFYPAGGPGAVGNFQTAVPNGSPSQISLGGVSGAFFTANNISAQGGAGGGAGPVANSNGGNGTSGASAAAGLPGNGPGAGGGGSGGGHSSTPALKGGDGGNGRVRFWTWE